LTKRVPALKSTIGNNRRIRSCLSDFLILLHQDVQPIKLFYFSLGCSPTIVTRRVSQFRREDHIMLSETARLRHFSPTNLFKKITMLFSTAGVVDFPEPPPRKQSTASVKLLVTHITCQGCALRQRAPVAQPGRYHNQPRALPWYDPLKKAKVTSSNLVRGSTPSSVPHYPYSSSFLENPLPFNPSL